MAVDTNRVRELLDRFEFEQVLVSELGWDNPPAGVDPVVVPEDEIAATQIADKRGVGVWRIDSIPPAPVRRRIDVAVSKFSKERLLVFVGDNEQLWLWPEQRASGTGYRLIGHSYYPGKSNDPILQRLIEASFTIDEEGTLTVMDILERVRRSFSADEVTKKFYKEFRKNHEKLMHRMQGIDDETHKSWYGSVLLNRLMFIYFMQKKRFLDEDPDYLRNRLRMVREHLGRGAFYGFFRQFLLPLFHDGLGSHIHDYPDSEIARIIGDVPYVNGGIFSPHLLEKTYDIDVPDEAFEAIFEFFDRYRWHLDERPSEEPNEINPDVLGYIFEQYVNQKEQGAYYTKEDVTGYMATSTLIPALIDRLGNPEDLWVLPTIDPDRYIWESVAYGADEPLPDEVSAGLDDHAKRNVWTNKTPASHGLPGETWWETIDRHRRYRELRGRLANGEVTDPDEAVSANIDLRTLLEDHFRMLTTMEELEQAWEVVSRLTILDPTCGSGAFLFAALEILADLYSALIERAVELATPLDAPSFLRSLTDHPNRDYFVMKSALLNNLYGVDLMYEAGEIARLRLFLKLAAQLTKRAELEPLPDLDFNIRTGNLLVGIADVDDAEQRLSQDLVGLTRLNDIVMTAEDVADAYEDFVRSQRDNEDPSSSAELKAALSAKLDAMREDVDEFLFEARGERGDIANWQKSHQPFHWFIEFPGAFLAGGFDVVVGNPPYISARKVGRYRWQGFETDDAPDIYALCVERAKALLNDRGRFAMILPISFQFSDQFEVLRNLMHASLDTIWVSTFSRNPAALFSAGLGVRSTVMLGSSTGTPQQRIFVSKLNRWVDEYRQHLFANLAYTELPEALMKFGWPRLENERFAQMLKEFVDSGSTIGSVVSTSGGQAVRFKTTALYYLSVFTQDPPSYDLRGRPISQTKVGSLSVATSNDASAVVAVLLSKVALAWWAATSDDFDVTAKGLTSTPIGPNVFEASEWLALGDLGRRIEEEMRNEVIYTKYAGKWIGNYDVKYVRHLTDDIDRMILEVLDLGEYWPDLELFYAGFMKATGERPGTLREIPIFEE